MAHIMQNAEEQFVEIPIGSRWFVKPIVFIVCILATGFLGVTDHLSGYEISFSIFYLLPISFASIFLGRAAGFTISFISACAWLVADLASEHTYSQIVIPYWNATVRLGYFSVHTIIISILLKNAAKMRSLALSDHLTGASSWRFFEETARREIERMHRTKKPITVSYIDLDNFKSVNDAFGHDAGDDLLRKVVDVIQKSIRSSDLLARIGGDEFAVLFPETDLQSGKLILSRLRVAFNSIMKSNNYPVTMSIGSVTFTTQPASVETMLKQADNLMYAVKNNGKNNIIFEEWPLGISELAS